MIPRAADSYQNLPAVSVIIAARNAGSTILSCLHSLRQQLTTTPFEIIVVDSSTDETPALIRSHFPDVTLLHYGERKYCGDARNIAIAKARAPIIACLDADCTAAPDWLEAILAAHTSSSALAIGGAIGNGNPESYVGWGAFFTEFSQWLPTAENRSVDDIAGASMTYKKEVFSRFGNFIEGTYGSDTEFHWRLGKAGHRLLFEPSIRIFHKNISCLRSFLQHETEHGRHFATVRLTHHAFGPLRRLVYGCGSPFIAGLLFFRLTRRTLANKAFRYHSIKALPLTALGVACWSYGECTAYLNRNIAHANRK